MSIPAERILDALRHEIGRLKVLFADSSVDGSAIMSIENGLQILLNREAGGRAALVERFAGLADVLNQVEQALGRAIPEIDAELAALRKTAAELGSREDIAALEQGWRGALARLQALVTRINGSAKVPAAAKRSVTKALVAWEADVLQSQAAPRPLDDGDAASAVDVGRDNLTAYLRDRFAEPTLEVTSFQPLAGGFGKQTVLFDVEGAALRGSFVIRRDIGTRPSVANDCHRIRDEYPVIKAAFARGFPAPDALWLDAEHRLLPGGDFIVMRRSPGRLAGNFFGARTEIPAGLTDALADVMAKLHAQEPMTELGNLTESIRLDRWKLSRAECTARYIRDWYELYLREEHMPSPALTSIYGWLLDNVPDRGGSPSLVHGDIGFHNFLFDGDRLSAVLDWEFAHIGDPAEELGYVKVTVGGAIDWSRLMARYVAGGGEPVDEQTLRYFQVWGYARNATGANLLSTLLANGHATDLKLAILPVAHIPQFIRGAQALIDAG